MRSNRRVRTRGNFERNSTKLLEVPWGSESGILVSRLLERYLVIRAVKVKTVKTRAPKNKWEEVLISGMGIDIK